MKRFGIFKLFVALLLVAGNTLFGQGVTTSALRGRVINENQGLPGVSVELRSPTLQGVRTTVSSSNGDYTFAALPPGEYTVAFKLQGFEPVTKKVTLVTAQQATLDATMAVAGVTAVAAVTAVAETVSTTTQASTTFNTDLTNKLPIARTLIAAVELSSGISRTQTLGNAVTISGAQTFDNVFTVDGAVVTDNVRSTPNNLFIEDAIQETTTSVSAVSAEFGRFTGGVVNTVTKSGGNTFSGSFRTTLTNDAWTAISGFRSATAPNGEERVQHVNPRYEATIGGPIWKDHIWFFGSGRFEKTEGSGQTSFTNIPFATATDEKRYQGKLTLTPVSNHTLTGSYLKVDRKENGNFFGVIMDLDSLVNRQLPQEIITANYNGVLTSNLFIEGLYSRRKFTFENSGSTYTDLIKGTLMRDLSRGNARYNSPTFCGVCDPEKRDNRDFLIKGTYFLSTGSLGSHNIVVGYDNFAGQRTANNYQSGSNYRLFTTSTILKNGDIFPVIDSKSYVYYTPIEALSKGTDTLTHSVFINDSWRLNERLSLNVGIRWDKNNAEDSRGVVTADDSGFSPRLAATYDVTGTGSLKVAASYAKYIGGIQDNLVDSASNGGQPGVLEWYYTGTGATPINTGNPANPVTRAAALQQVFDWFFAQGCPNLQTCKLPLAYAFIPGLTRQIRDTLRSPYAREYTVGVNGAMGKASFRADFVRREFGDFYNTVLNTSTGKVSNGLGSNFDLGINTNSNSLTRNYTALQTQFSYRTGGLFLGGNWTWSHTIGNIDGEAGNTGPTSAAFDTYPEYKDPAWNNPNRDLLTDQRHRVRIFATYDLPFVPRSAGVVTLSAIEAIETGAPYGAIGTVRSRTYVTNPGYVTPPSSVNYYYTAGDAFRTDTIKRTDFSVNFSKKFGDLVEVFVQPQILNLFNTKGVIATSTAVLTVLNSSGTRKKDGTLVPFAPFNPFTTTPTERNLADESSWKPTDNWARSATCTATTATNPGGCVPVFGQPRNKDDYQLPRTFQITMGIRF